MLEYLELDNVGPAPRMKVEFAPRVNIITGDNGLGKSFLLDTAWWALTGAWPAEVNRRMTSGLPARPRDKGQEARILWRTRYGDGVVESGLRYSRTEEAWTPKAWPQSIPGPGRLRAGRWLLLGLGRGSQRLTTLVQHAQSKATASVRIYGSRGMGRSQDRCGRETGSVV